MVLKAILAVTLIAAAVFLQGADFKIGGVKPNFILVILMIFAFLTADLIYYAILVLLSLILLRFQPGLNWELLIVTALSFAAFLLGRRLPWRETINFLIVASASTIIFYLFIDPKFIYSNSGTLALELSFNLLSGFILFLLLKNEKTSGTKFRF